MKRIDPQRRPQYSAVERMAILEWCAMRGWNKAETARRLFVTDDTIRAWLRRGDDDLLVQIHASAAAAVLLVAGHRRRSLFPSLDGHCGLRGDAEFRPGAFLSRQGNTRRWPSAEASPTEITSTYVHSKFRGPIRPDSGMIPRYSRTALCPIPLWW